MVAESTIVGIVGWFGGSFVNTGISKIRSIWEDHQELQEGAAQMLRDLMVTVPLVRLYLDEANRRVTAAQADFKPCLVDIKGYVSEAENLLDEFEVKKILKNSKVSDKLAIDDNNVKKLKAVLDNLNKNLNKLKDFLGMCKSNSSEEKMIGLLPSLPPTSKSVVHGRVTEIQKLLGIILPSESEYGYIPESIEQEGTGGRACMDHLTPILVQGTAGVGKTTLAKEIHDHPLVKEAFGMRGWVFVNRWDVICIYENIIQSFKAEQQHFDSHTSLASLQTRPSSSRANLASIIESKRFLLVLDDVQDNFLNIWADLRTTLNKGAKGSIVLVTTRSDEVAETMGVTFKTDNCITLPPLPHDNLWTILKDRTLQEQENISLKSIGEKITHNLHGLPLLAELIGRLLRQKLNEEHWQKVSESTWWTYTVDLDNPALPSVKTVCEYLTIPLNKCLCYCSIFPSGYLFEKNKLIHMWMANFAHQKGIESMKEIFFNELLSMSFFQPMHLENMYVMHDLLRESTAHVNWEELYDATEKGRGKRALDDHQVIDIGKFDMQLDLSKASTVRTMVFTDSYRTTNRNEKLAEVLSHSSDLRVLDLSYIKMEPTSRPSSDLQELNLSNIEIESTSPPDVIATFEHLRFLDLSYTKITKVPESFCKLYLLQVLGLRGCHFKSLPKSMNDLINLTYLYAEARTISLIAKIGQLTNLLELDEFHVSERNRIIELKNLNQLGGQLCIANLEKVSPTADAAEAELCRKTHLNRLVLKWNDPVASDSDDCMSVLEGLEPPRNLKELRIQGYRGFIFPKWAGKGQDFISLGCIYISHCEKLECLPPLGLLPALRVLLLDSLPSIKQIDNAFYGDKKTVFKSLLELTFHSMLAWENWSEIEIWQSIPQLKKVRIDNCPNLKEAPLHSFAETLLELVLSDCDSILSRKICLQEFRKLKHLTVCKHSGPITLPCSSLTSLVVLNVLNDGSKLDLGWGTELPPNLRLLVINGRIQLIPKKTKPGMQSKNSEARSADISGEMDIDQILHQKHKHRHIYSYMDSRKWRDQKRTPLISMDGYPALQLEAPVPTIDTPYTSSPATTTSPAEDSFNSPSASTLPQAFPALPEVLADFDTMDLDASSTEHPKEETDGSDEASREIDITAEYTTKLSQTKSWGEILRDLSDLLDEYEPRDVLENIDLIKETVTELLVGHQITNDTRAALENLCKLGDEKEAIYAADERQGQRDKLSHIKCAGVNLTLENHAVDGQHTVKEQNTFNKQPDSLAEEKTDTMLLRRFLRTKKVARVQLRDLLWQQP